MSSQYFKTLYFSDRSANRNTTKTVTIAFNQAERQYFKIIKGMSNQEIRELADIESYKHLRTMADSEDRSVNNIIKRQIKKKIFLESEIRPMDGTFKKCKDIPFQRWYPYIEGYSPDYVQLLIQKYSLENSKIIYDPFVGTGTSIFAADELNLQTAYSEVNPLLQFIIETKVSILTSEIQIRTSIADNLKTIANNLENVISGLDIDEQLNKSYKELFKDSVYFDKETYNNILKIRTYIDNIKLTSNMLSDIISIGVISSLIPISLLKKQGDVRFKTKEELKCEKIHFFKFLHNKLNEFADDIINTDYSLNKKPEFVIGNAKNISYIKGLPIDAIITSPPYLNGTNYFRNTKLELWFLRYLQFDGDLRLLRDQALTSGINDVNKGGSINSNEELLKKSGLFKITFDALSKNAYDRRIPIMVNNYFDEMYTVFKAVYFHLNKNAKIIIDIGDSVFGGVHVATDDILIELFYDYYNLIEKKEIRKRRSKNQAILHQVLLVFEKKNKDEIKTQLYTYYHNDEWQKFKKTLPHKEPPFSKKNWGHPNHSICSYQGKLKPSIAHHLVSVFAPKGGKIFDPFSGVGTIPFEAALNGRQAFGIDISLPAYYISNAKVSINDKKLSHNYIAQMEQYIITNQCYKNELDEVRKFGFNKTLADYYECKTLKEIILARRFIKEQSPPNTSEMLVIASLLHILHGNRPYALSRRSHPIVPYAPQGNFEYKNLIERLKTKVDKSYYVDMPFDFIQGKIYNQDSTLIWPQEINNLDAVITSPLFFDSTRFYLTNWIRLWFSGWSPNDFKCHASSFIEEKQKKEFVIYEKIFRQSRERLKSGGVFVMHLGKSNKCNMAEELQKISKRWFTKVDIFDESVEHCESHGIRDKGTVTSHQYLIMI